MRFQRFLVRFLYISGYHDCAFHFKSGYVMQSFINNNYFSPWQTLRVQSSEGTKRLEVDPTDTTCQLFEAVHSTFDLSSFAFAIYRERNNKDEVHSSKSRSIKSVGLKHGDMLYLKPLNGTVLFPQPSTSAIVRIFFKWRV